MSRAIKAVIFDMDGTILDTLDDLTDAVNHTLRANGMAERTREEVHGFVGNGAEKLIRRAVPADTPQELVKKVFDEYVAYYDAHCAVKTIPYGGIAELLADLRASGVKTAVVSNKPDAAVQELCRAYFPDLFDAATGMKSGMKKKPAPDALLAAIAELGVEKSVCVYVGDSEVDIETAKNAGLPCISVAWGFKRRDFLAAHNAQKIVDNVDELRKALAAVFRG